MKETIGVVITTYNSESYFKDLYDSLPFDLIDELVVVNGGNKYTNDYSRCDWIQHKSNHFPSVCRNDGLRFLRSRNIDHYFTIEDDMILKKPDIFEQYIQHAKAAKIEYLCFASTSWGGGEPFKRTPKLTIEFKDEKKISFYPNMCNEFTYRSCRLLDQTGYYDEHYRHMFDVDNVYKICKSGLATPFWWFPDIYNSDEYIMNNPEGKSRLQVGNKRNEELPKEMEYFHKKTGLYLREISYIPEEEVIQTLKNRFPI